VKVRRIYTIAEWEFLRYLKSRSFLLATFISPVVLALLLIIPSFFYQNSRLTRPQVIGVIEFDSTNYNFALAERFNDSINAEQGSRILLKEIEADTSSILAGFLSRQKRLGIEKDSLDDAYNQIKERRKYVFQRPGSANRESLLRQTYEQLHQTREARDFAVIEYNHVKSLTDSLIRSAVFKKADRLLAAQEIQGYIVFEPTLFKEGKIEFHSLLPINFFRIDRLKQTLQELLVEERMREEGVTTAQIQEWLKPIEIQELRLEGSEKREFNIMVTYLGPIIVVLFLFIGIFTSSGFLFNSIYLEQSSHIIELMISSARSTQVIFGKLIGLGILGLFQVLVWMAITALFVFTDLIPSNEIGFLTLRNGAIFILYFILGYLFFSAVFVSVGFLSSSEDRARHLNQLIRIASIFPIILAILVLESPNSLLIRILSFIPLLTPSLMILRTPLGQPPIIDYWISGAIMLFVTILSLAFAVRVFKIGSLDLHQKIRGKEMFSLFRVVNQG
jgi:ABC-type Na+ efflux pump permease subunit